MGEIHPTENLPAMGEGAGVLRMDLPWASDEIRNDWKNGMRITSNNL